MQAYRYLYLKFQIWKRKISALFAEVAWADECSDGDLPYSVFSHSSPIKRRLGNVDMQLQENKAQNLQLAARELTGVLLRPGERFSFWRLVGQPTFAKGYLPGLMLTDKGSSTVLAGGLCQLTNLIHWLVLHSPMSVVEHHHHDGVDLFPDQDRKVPFGLGTSIMYNFLDYQFRNDTQNTYQLKVWVEGDNLKGELRSVSEQKDRYVVEAVDERFSLESDGYYRYNEVWRSLTNRLEGNVLKEELIKRNRALVMYDSRFIRGKVLVGAKANTGYR